MIPVLFLVVLTELFLAFLLFYRWSMQPVGESLFEPGPKWKRLLILSSAADEAWQVLSRIVTLDNPLAPVPLTWKEKLKSVGPWSMSVLKEAIRNDGLLNRTNRLLRMMIWGGGGFLLVLSFVEPLGVVEPHWALPVLVLSYAAVLLGSATFDPIGFFDELRAPLRMTEVLVAYVRAVASELAVTIMRYFGWSVLGSIALGKGGYPFSIAPVSQVPAEVSEHFFTYESLTAEVVGRALTRREKGLGSSTSAITTALSSPDFDPFDFNALLKRIANDTSLIHAAYYTDDSCVERIADWLARSEDDLIEEEAAELDTYMQAHDAD
jgi:hypothetical protein